MASFCTNQTLRISEICVKSLTKTESIDMIFSEFIRKGVEEEEYVSFPARENCPQAGRQFQNQKIQKVALDAGYLKRQITNWSADLEIRGTSRISRNHSR